MSPKLVQMSLGSRRRRFADSRPPQSDADLVAAVGARSSLAAAVISVRRTMGRLCHFPPEAIHAGDSPETLGALLDEGDVIDFLDFVFAMESECGHDVEGDGERPMPRLFEERFFWWFRKPGAASFGAWALELGRWAAPSGAARAAVEADHHERPEERP